MGNTIIIKLTSIYVLFSVDRIGCLKVFTFQSLLQSCTISLVWQDVLPRRGNILKSYCSNNFNYSRSRTHTKKMMTQPFPVGMLYKRMPGPQQVSGVSQTLPELFLVTCSSSQLASSVCLQWTPSCLSQLEQAVTRNPACSTFGGGRR